MNRDNPVHGTIAPGDGLAPAGGVRADHQLPQRHDLRQPSLELQPI